MTRPLCIYHSPCADGFTAAWVVNRFFDGEVDFHPGVYGEAPPDVADRDVILVDFSYKRPVLWEVAQSAKSVLLLDHHLSAVEDVGNVPIGEYARCNFGQIEPFPPNCHFLFDMERSGAQIAWDFFFPDPDGPGRPSLINYVGDRDLWRFSFTNSREINAYIFAHDYTFENWDRLENELLTLDGMKRATAGGEAIERKHHKDVKELVTVTRRTMIIGGYEVPVANIPYTLTSDAGNLMCIGAPFAACYWDTPNGRVFSLRSTDSGVNVSLIAKAYGGGGHRNASGFQKELGWEGDRPVSRNAEGEGI